MKKCEKNEIGIKKAYSYKIYSLSVIFTFVGFLLNILFIKYSVESLLLTFSSIQFKIFVLGYLILSIVLSIILYLIVKKEKVYDLTYFLGFSISFISILLSIFLFKDASFMMLGTFIGYSLMLSVLKGYCSKFELMESLIGNDYQKGISRNVFLNFVVSIVLSLIIFMGCALIYHFVGDAIINYLVFISPVFMILGQAFVSIQPLDDVTYKKLKNYELHLDNLDLKNKLNKLFVEKRHRPAFVMFLRKVFKFLLGYKVVGKEFVDEEDLPAIFVSNHGEYYGPIAAVANMPYSYRPWIESQLLEPEKGYPYTYKYTFSLITWLPVFMRKLLAKISVNVVARVFSAFDPVPVYRSELRSIFKTFNISVEALKQGDSILLFPESTHNTEDGKYAKNGQVGDFFTGFAHIGVKYFEETGKQIKFYPIYLDKKKRKFIIGKGIEFNSNNDRSLEKKRLVEELRNSMENLRSF